MKTYYLNVFSRVNSFLLISLLSVTVLAQTQSQESQSKEILVSVKQQMAELNKTFTYKGKLLHPRAIKDLTSWVADPLPGPIAIDVEGTYDTNRYFGEYTKREDGLIFIDLKQKYVELEGWFGYEYLGRLANGFHVLRIFDNGGGTGVFQSLLLVECIVNYEYKIDGSRREMLVLQRRGEFGIGDRYDGEIKIEPKENAITIGIDKRNVEKPFRVKLQQ